MPCELHATPFRALPDQAASFLIGGHYNAEVFVHIQVALLDFGATRGFDEKFTDLYIEVRARAAAVHGGQGGQGAFVLSSLWSGDLACLCVAGFAAWPELGTRLGAWGRRYVSLLCPLPELTHHASLSAVSPHLLSVETWAAAVSGVEPALALLLLSGSESRTRLPISSGG